MPPHDRRRCRGPSGLPRFSIVVHSGGGRAKALATRLKELGAQAHLVRQDREGRRPGGLRASGVPSAQDRRGRRHRDTADRRGRPGYPRTGCRLLTTCGGHRRGCRCRGDPALPQRTAEVTGFDVADKAVQGDVRVRGGAALGDGTGSAVCSAGRCAGRGGAHHCPGRPAFGRSLPAGRMSPGCRRGGFRKRRNSPGAGRQTRWSGGAVGGSPQRRCEWCGGRRRLRSGEGRALSGAIGGGSLDGQLGCRPDRSTCPARPYSLCRDWASADFCSRPGP